MTVLNKDFKPELCVVGVNKERPDDKNTHEEQIIMKWGHKDEIIMK